MNWTWRRAWGTTWATKSWLSILFCMLYWRNTGRTSHREDQVKKKQELLLQCNNLPRTVSHLHYCKPFPPGVNPSVLNYSAHLLNQVWIYESVVPDDQPLSSLPSPLSPPLPIPTSLYHVPGFPAETLKTPCSCIFHYGNILPQRKWVCSAQHQEHRVNLNSHQG